MIAKSSMAVLSVSISIPSSFSNASVTACWLLAVKVFTFSTIAPRSASARVSATVSRLPITALA